MESPFLEFIEAHRPLRHFVAPLGTWINDPVPFYDTSTGRTHIFLQHNPNAPVWGDMHWFHTSTSDYQVWENHGIALAPSRTEGDPDFGGVWTGSITRRPSDGKFIALYTAIPEYKQSVPLTQLQCAALSEDLMTWEKFTGNPLIGLSEKPDGYGDCFRDPQTFLGPEGKWYCLIGGEKPDGAGGVVFLYESTDDSLLNWKYRHVLFAGGPETGHDFECPDFFPLDDSNNWCLITSRGKSFWHIGTLDADTMQFTRTDWGECDTELFYAAKSSLGKKGERLLWGWIHEGRPEPEQIAAGWSGVLSSPRILRADTTSTVVFAAFSGASNREEGYTRLQVEIPVPTDENRFVGTVPANSELRFNSSDRYSNTKISGGILLKWASGEELRLLIGENDREILVRIDGSLIEVFAGSQVQTYRMYAKEPDTVHIYSQV